MKPAAGQQVDDRPGEVAAAEDPLLHRFEAMLPAADPLVGGQPVFDEVQGPSGLEDAPHLAKGRRRHPGSCTASRWTARCRSCCPRTAATGRPDRTSAPGCSSRRRRLLGQFPADVGGLDRGDARDGRRIERDVEPRAEADLDDLPLEPVADAAAQRLGALEPARDVDDPREDVLAVNSMTEVSRRDAPER